MRLRGNIPRDRDAQRELPLRQNSHADHQGGEGRRDGRLDLQNSGGHPNRDQDSDRQWGFPCVLPGRSRSVAQDVVQLFC